MADTKENILNTALRLFAQSGYEATSVSDIAGELHMTKGALYKHYKNKQDIFDSIVKRLYRVDAERAKAFGAPEEPFDKAPHTFGDMSMEQMIDFLENQLKYLIEDEFASSVRKMLILEQYRNPDMAQLYQSWLVSGPVDYIEDLIREMMSRGIWKSGDTKMLALELYAPFFLLLSVSDFMQNKEDATTLLTAHIERFIENNAAR